MDSQIEGAGKAGAIEYLNKGRQQKETVREFVDHSRKILMAQISINDKTDETQLLKEYIIMEKEKLAEQTKTFKEDQAKYEKFKMDLQAKSNKTEEDVRQVQKDIETLQNEIQELKKEEATLNSQYSKFQEEIVLHKAHKRFLDLLAISAKVKQPVNQRERKAIKAEMNGRDSGAGLGYDELSNSVGANNRGGYSGLSGKTQTNANQRGAGDSVTFMTQGRQEQQQMPIPRQNPPRGALQKGKSTRKTGAVSIANSNNQHYSKPDEEVQNALRMATTQGQGQDLLMNNGHAAGGENELEANTSDIDLNGEYSDDDTKIYFDEKQFLAYLHSLEEGNLFKMNLNQESEQTLEKMRQESIKSQQMKRQLIVDVEENIALQ